MGVHIIGVLNKRMLCLFCVWMMVAGRIALLGFHTDKWLPTKGFCTLARMYTILHGEGLFSALLGRVHVAISADHQATSYSWPLGEYILESPRFLPKMERKDRAGVKVVDVTTVCTAKQYRCDKCTRSVSGWSFD